MVKKTALTSAKIVLLIGAVVCFSSNLFAQAILRADGPGDTYELINSILAPGAEAVESPECIHPEFGRHIAEVWDADLKCYVFEFYSHVRPDNDRCINFDRQRVEIKTYDPSPDSLKGTTGDVVIYKWRFKLPQGFQPSTSFTHLHQVKAVGGDDDAPIFTLTARKASPNRIELIHNNTTKETTANLSLFENSWVEATETIKVDSLHGSYSIIIKRLSDGLTVLSYTNSNLMTIRYNNTFIRPKWGIYRSLLDSANLRDEAVRFNDFSVGEIASPKSQNITFAPLPVKLPGDTDFNPEASASSGLPVSFSSSNPAVAVVQNNVVHLVGIGKTIITASQEGNAAFLPAASVSQTLAVAPLSRLLNPVADAYTYGSSPDFNFGKDTILIVKENGTLAYSRKSFLRFDLAGIDVPNLILGKIRFYCNYITLAKVSSLTLWSAPDNWSELTITYNNMPAPLTKLGTLKIDATPAFYELDITPYVGSCLKKGLCSVVLSDETASNALIKFNSREARNSLPELLLAGSSSADALSVAESLTDKCTLTQHTGSQAAQLTLMLKNAARVDAQLYDLNGGFVSIVLSDAFLESGIHQRNVDLHALGAGCYILKLRAGIKILTSKVIIRP